MSPGCPAASPTSSPARTTAARASPGYVTSSPPRARTSATTRTRPSSTSSPARALASATDDEGERERVTLCTVHGAKGLEWQVVLICGLEEGTFPSQHAALGDALEE